MRTLSLLVIVAGMGHADTLFTVSTSAFGQSCTQSGSASVFCSVPEQVGHNPPYYGPAASADIEVGQGIIFGPLAGDSSDAVEIDGFIDADGTEIAAIPPSLASASLSMTFSIPAFWGNVYFYGNASLGAYVTANGQEIYFPQDSADDILGEAPVIIDHAAGISELITFSDSVSAINLDQFETSGFDALFVNSNALPEPPSLYLLAIAFAAAGIGRCCCSHRLRLR